MTLHIITIPNDACKNDQIKLELFKFDFETKPSSSPSLLAISQDSSQLFHVVQIGSTDTKNSWFYGNTVVEDGRMFGLLPVLKGWLFLTIFSQCAQSKLVFLTIDDVFSHSEQENSMLSRIFKANSVEIEGFLKKIMPSQVNLEGDLAFRFETAKIAEAIFNLIKDQSLSEAEKPLDLTYFELKWSCKSDLVIILDNLQTVLPLEIFSLLCEKCSLQPASPEDLNKRLKISESMLLKPIRRGAGGDENVVLAPTDDYSKFESKLKPEKAKNPKFAVTGNTSMLNFFKKATK